MLNRSDHTSGATSQFKFELLKQITNDFSEERVIGRGAYGVVYKGVFDNGEEMAVKKLMYMPPEHDSDKQFHNECINLMRVQHQNIVRLVGYCDETHRRCVKYDGEYVFADENERALCLEYLAGGSLEKHVSKEPCGLDWNECYKIIRGVCEGLNHLHNGYQDSIFHLDLKPANILLDNNKMPKIGDFGLSRLFSSTETCTTATPLGTKGYTPPEYINRQEISQKYDVFSLGVIIIHIMAGRQHYYDHVDTPYQLFELVCENWKRRIRATMWSHASQEVRTCIEIALRCVKFDRQERPTICKIVEDLNRIHIGKLMFTSEATNVQSMDALDYNQYTNSVSMGVHDSATSLVAMEGIDYARSVSDEVGENQNRRDSTPRVIRGHTSRAIMGPQDMTHTTEVGILGYFHHRRNPHIRHCINWWRKRSFRNKKCPDSVLLQVAGNKAAHGKRQLSMRLEPAGMQQPCPMLLIESTPNQGGKSGIVAESTLCHGRHYILLDFYSIKLF